MLKRITVSLLLVICVFMSFTVSTFAATVDLSNTPGLVSERVVTDENGNKIVIRVYTLDENGNIPVPQSRASETILYNNSTWLSTGGFSILASNQVPLGISTEAVSCYNMGSQPVTFQCDSSSITEQAVSVGEACQFIITWKVPGTKPMYSVGAKANWSDHQSWIKITRG